MKKISLIAMMAIMSLTIFPTSMLANTTNPTTATNSPKEVPADVKVMLNRLEEIKEMDKSSLNSTEKKELRKEVKAIKSTLKSSGNGVYLSVGAIIIIVLLLILLL